MGGCAGGAAEAGFLAEAWPELPRARNRVEPGEAQLGLSAPTAGGQEHLVPPLSGHSGPWR